MFSLSISTSREHSIFSHIECSNMPVRSSGQLYFGWVTTEQQSFEHNVLVCQKKNPMCTKQFYHTRRTIWGWYFTLTLVFSLAFSSWKYIRMLLKYLLILYGDLCNKYYIHIYMYVYIYIYIMSGCVGMWFFIFWDTLPFFHFLPWWPDRW